MSPITFVGSAPFKRRAQPAKPAPVWPFSLLGLHDPGGEHLLAGASRPGPTLFTHELGHDPHSEHGFDYSPWSGRFLIARLNNGYNPNGTIPLPLHYADFARRVGHHVRLSTGGCHVWIIGNETNHMIEFPFGYPISPDQYSVCFALCRHEIKRVPGHADDWVIAAPVAPYYPPGAWGGYLDYFRQIVTLCDTDAICLHAYGRSAHPSSVNQDHILTGGTYKGLQWEFRTYRDFLNAVPQSKRHLPALITETNQEGAWTNANTGWVQAAVREIQEWNAAPHAQQTQQIRALVLYRWPAGLDRWGIEKSHELHEDIRAAASLC